MSHAHKSGPPKRRRASAPSDGVQADAILESLVVARTRVLIDANVQLRTEAVEREIGEGALRQSQKIEAVSQLTGGLAHDFNNLMQALSGSLDLMRTRIRQGRVHDLDSYITIARTASDRAASLVHSLLAFSRRQTLAPKPTDLNTLVDGMLAALKVTLGPDIRLEMALAPALPATLCDPLQFEHVLLNLATNARHAMPDGGSLLITTAQATLPDHRAPSADAALLELPPGDYVTLAVADTGTGMPASVAIRAFDPFFTTKSAEGGTGLGLSMVYGFVRQSDGLVRIHSQEGVGTSVTIFMPQYADKPQQGAAPVATPAPPSPEMAAVVLVVEDEQVIRSVLLDVLSEAGYTLLEAANGREGLAILESPVTIDLLITDIGLPGGMNGRQLADAARQQRAGLKVLFITGYATGSAFGHGGVAEGMEVMTKPFRLDELTAKARSMISSRSTGECAPPAEERWDVASEIS